MAQGDKLKEQIEQAFDLVGKNHNSVKSSRWLERSLLVLAIVALGLGLTMLASVFFL